MIEGWYRRARTFILKQQQEQLQNAVRRYPNSSECERRKNELRDIELELEELQK